MQDYLNKNIEFYEKSVNLCFAPGFTVFVNTKQYSLVITELWCQQENTSYTKATLNNYANMKKAFTYLLTIKKMEAVDILSI